MLDGLDLVLRWFLNDVRGRFPDSPVLFADESGGSPHRGTIRNRLRRLMESLRPAVAGFAESMLRARERARRAGTRPRSDPTIETALSILRDLTRFPSLRPGQTPVGAGRRRRHREVPCPPAQVP
jgi:hypothetical protein